MTVIEAPEDPFWGALPTKLRGLSDSAEVVGHYWNPLNDVAYRWTAGIGFVPLSFPGDVLESQTRDVNGYGQIAGMLERPDPPGFRAFVWSPSDFVEIPPPPAGSWSQAAGSNHDGTVVGTTTDGTPYYKAFVWSNGTMTVLATPIGPRSEGRDINSAGQVVGWMGVAPEIEAHPFLRDDGEIVDLGLLPGSYSAVATALNGPGDVVGTSWFDNARSGYVTRATRWSSGQILNLGPLSRAHERGIAHGINTAGQIVGSSGEPALYRAFLWQDAQMYDLNDLGPADAGVLMTSARAINDAGQIAGEGISFATGQTVGVLMTPVNRPSGDLDVDCEVGTSDLLMLLMNWGKCPARPGICSADIDGDNHVATSDLLLLLSNWSS